MQNYESLREQDKFIYNEIFEVNAYNVKEHEIKGKVVIDVGANVGMFSLLAMKLGAKKVLAFEPEMLCFNALVKNSKDFNFPYSIECINKAVTSKDGITVYVKPQAGGLSIVTDEHTSEVQEVKNITLEDAIQLRSSDQDRLVLKMDCEGSEYDILLHTSVMMLRKFEYIYIEIHENNESQEAKSLIEYIKGHGYEYSYCQEFFNHFPNKPPEVNPNKVHKFRRKDIDARCTDVTCVISTKDRYYSTLPHTILAICQQTLMPKELIIYDDGEHKDLRNDPVYSHIFALLDYYGLKDKWKVNFGGRIGQVANHIKSTKVARCEWIWRLDDDNIPEHDVLEKLVSNINENVGAVGGLVITSTDIHNLPFDASNKIEDIFLGKNEQWYLHPKDAKPKEVDHLYSSFIYRKSIAEYCPDLSVVGHREETILTYEIKRKGYSVIIDPSAKTWHFANPEGGIRSHKGNHNHNHDEGIFLSKLREWKITPSVYNYVVLDNGIGDHYAFKYWLPEYLEFYKNKSLILFTCYPEVFKDTGIRQGSIADALQMFGNLDRFNIYKWMDECRWSKNLPWAFKSMYNVLGGGNKEKKSCIGSGNYIVVSPFSRTPSHPKSYPYWSDLVAKLKTLGYTLIQIGATGEPRLEGIEDYRINMSFTDIETLISNCKFWISVDNFLPHLCHNMKVTPKGVVLWGVSNPKIFGYEYNLNIINKESYFRPDQFGKWDGMVRNDSAFCDVQFAFEQIINTFNIKETK